MMRSGSRKRGPLPRCASAPLEVEGGGWMNTRDIVFTRDDGSEVLVTLWTDGIATMAERQDAGDIWSPPINARIDNGGVVPLKRPQMPGAAIGSTGPHCPWCARTDAHAHPVNTDIDFVWTPSDGERE